MKPLELFKPEHCDEFVQQGNNYIHIKDANRILNESAHVGYAVKITSESDYLFSEVNSEPMRCDTHELFYFEREIEEEIVVCENHKYTNTTRVEDGPCLTITKTDNKFCPECGEKLI